MTGGTFAEDISKVLDVLVILVENRRERSSEKSDMRMADAI